MKFLVPSSQTSLLTHTILNLTTSPQARKFGRPRKERSPALLAVWARVAPYLVPPAFSRRRIRKSKLSALTPKDQFTLVICQEHTKWKASERTSFHEPST